MSPPRPAAPRGMTLVEMLVATTCTLLLMGAIAQVFGAFGTAVSDSRSMIELDARLRSTAWRLRSDLAGATARTLPPLEVEAGEGYLEIIEGPRTEADAGGNGSPLAPADIDDALLFTTRNTETPFIGKYDYSPGDVKAPKSTESQLAEVGWFLRPADTVALGSQQVTTFTLFRKQLLVIGYVGFTPFYGGATPNAVPWGDYNSWAAFFDRFDLSVQLQAGPFSVPPILVSNSLADLTRRETRFMHNAGGLIDATAGTFTFAQHAWQNASPQSGLIFDRTAGSTRVGEDVVLTNVLSFDVRVFDPSVPVVVSGGDALPLPDAAAGVDPTAVSGGAFVDLGWNKGPAPGIVAPSGYRPRFAGLGEPKSGLVGVNGCRVWDSWSTHYESNGVDDDGDGRIDQGSNGIDDDGDGKVDESPFDADGDGLYTGAGDDPGELETLPPYRFPLRGIEIRIRCYEPSSRQVRQVTVRHSFVPR